MPGFGQNAGSHDWQSADGIVRAVNGTLTSPAAAATGSYRLSDTLLVVSIVETILVYAAIPAAIYGVIALGTLRAKFAGTARYRPGQPWTYPPVWWTGHPEGVRRVHERHAETAGTRTESPRQRGGARGTW